jgi:hypothetical protein
MRWDVDSATAAVAAAAAADPGYAGVEALGDLLKDPVQRREERRREEQEQKANIKFFPSFPTFSPLFLKDPKP